MSCFKKHKKPRDNVLLLMFVMLFIIVPQAQAKPKIKVNFVSWEQFYYKPNFRINNFIMFEGFQTHFFTVGFTPWICASFVLGNYAENRGFGWEADIVGHRAMGRLNWDVPAFDISYPSYSARITGFDALLNANYLLSAGRFIFTGFTGGGLSASSFEIYQGDASESAEFTSISFDYGLRAIFKITNSFRLNIGYRGYLPIIQGCKLEPGLTLHAKYRPYDILAGISLSFNPDNFGR